VCGGGGFIGGHLIARLRAQGHSVRGVDLRPLGEWHQRFDDVENWSADLRDIDQCRRSVAGIDVVYNMAADMGGVGYAEAHKAHCMMSVLINTHLLMAARDAGIDRFFYPSSACVYDSTRRKSVDLAPLREDDVYPAMPEDGYGREKLFSERMCRHFREDFGLATRVARYHNVYGPLGTWKGGREKVPAAICRKVAEAKLLNTRAIDIWGDGQQMRTFTWIDDCISGTIDLLNSDIADPLNLDSTEPVSINQLVDIVESIAGVRLERRYQPAAPTGANNRTIDSSRIRAWLGWKPAMPLHTGLELTYRWIYDQMTKTMRTGAMASS
jgi:GDP-D-mannose 3', 5'-epimerase